MTLSPIDPSRLDVTRYIREGDLVTWGQAMGEPTELVSAYLDQRHRIGPTRAFVGLAFSGLLKEEHTDAISLISYGALGDLGPLVRKDLVRLVPCRYSNLPHLMRNTVLRPDVVFVQISPPGPDGSHSLGWCNDILPTAMPQARVVIAEINPAVPWVRMDQPLDESLITLSVSSDRPLPKLPSPAPGQLEAKLAGHLADYIPEAATLQYGVGAIPSAVLKALRGHRDLGLHSGLVTEDILQLVESGALTNARKSVLPGISVGAVAIGGPKLANYMTDNETYLSCRTEITHGAKELAQLDNLVAINSALEVDLFGQVNAEQVAGRYLGAIGGQPDYMHAATSAPNGLSIIALPSTSGRDGSRSRIVDHLNGPVVTTARSDVDLVATEYGVADLRGKDMRARAQALLSITAPQHREPLERAAFNLGLSR